MILVADSECDNLYNEATRMWCFVAKELGKDRWWRFYPDCYQHRHEIRALFAKADGVVMHNGIDYDSWVLDKLGIAPLSLTQPKIIDTLVMSTVLNPDRVKPPGIPAKAGPHSLAAWGVRVGMGKGDHQDFSQFSEEMLRYCDRDVLVGAKTYLALLKEMEK